MIACADIGISRYGDGSVRLWDAKTASILVSFNGHRSAITHLVFDDSGVRLASGAKDTDIVIWDLVAEVGLFKLRGHKDQITGLSFLKSEDITDSPTTESRSRSTLDRPSEYLLSTGKDALIKLWDLNSQHCLETHVAQSNGECWSLGVSPDSNGCITAGNEGELKVWSIRVPQPSGSSAEASKSFENFLQDQGVFYRQGKDRTIGIEFDQQANRVAVHGTEKAVEIFKVRSESEIQKALARKRKRRREKDASKEVIDKLFNESLDSEDISSASPNDIFISLTTIRTGGKVSSVAWHSKTLGNSNQLLVATSNNQLEVFDISAASAQKKQKSEGEEYTRTHSVDMQGHRTDVRSLSLSSDESMIASASSGSLKVWNVRTQVCIRTFECGYALCSSFLPGDKIVVLGTKSGHLELFDVASSSMIESFQAHDGSIWTLQVHPDGKSMVTGSADKTAKFWNFQVVQEEIPGSRRTTPRLKLVHTRTLKLADDLLCVRFSPDMRLLAVSLLDNTVKVFFVDSLKLFLNLYGHKLPVLNMDISYDSKLIVTCSADKNIRIWGLDFGDCHKALFAHQDSVMQVAFISHNQDGNGHHFFSASKDHMIKYWDGDKFEQIQKLGGHLGEIWALAVSRTGNLLVSASHDKSLRLWRQTDEQIFLEEEREKELEELYEGTLTTSLEQEEIPGEERTEVTAAGRQTVETLVAGERIVEALDLGMEDLTLVQEWERATRTQPNTGRPARSPLFLALGNISAEKYVLHVVQKIQAAALQDALLVLPFSKVTHLFTFLNIWASRGWNMPLTCRVLFFMLKTHHKQIVASKTMRPMLDEVRKSLRGALKQQKDEIGFNLAAMSFIGRDIEEQGTKDYIDEESFAQDQLGSGRKKRGFIDVA
jgi:U3 small nucleolar RNA-associated protein 12